MKTPKKLEAAFRKVEEIRYENENGGAYAYLQFMAHTREVIDILRPVAKADRQVETIEAMNWLLNEYLTTRFTPTHKLIFEDNMREIKTIFEGIRASLTEIPVKTVRKPFDGKLYHAQAA